MKSTQSLFVALVLANAAWACSDFSGTWTKGECSGEQAASLANSMKLTQNGCTEISSEEATITIDGQEHAGEGYTYVAKFETKSKPEDSLNVDLKYGSGATYITLKYHAEENERGIKTIRALGEQIEAQTTQTLADCVYHLQ